MIQAVHNNRPADYQINRVMILAASLTDLESQPAIGHPLYDGFVALRASEQVRLAFTFAGTIPGQT